MRSAGLQLPAVRAWALFREQQLFGVTSPARRCDKVEIDRFETR